MSLGKVKTNIVSGVKDLKTPEGMKRALVQLGVGAILGVIVDLVLQAIWVLGGVGDMLNKAGYPVLAGVKIFPQDTAYGKWNPTTKTNDLIQGDFICWDDVILIIITLALLLSKKVFFVIGFFLGWYFSSYLGLWQALGLPSNVDFLKTPAA